MQFQRIRLGGFKSFVEPAELLIQPGLTGIVGPNGCGKSNLVEALRWAMGETSAKRVRGDGMDDVIFSGSATRPARNIAEVAIVLDNHQRKAPAAYNRDGEIEVVRRIERDTGSRFTINGREARARDVQRLFADAASGAHSTALVSQGEIAALLKAKPKERRLLEEAAGITGLHSRRHEAELRLRAAETNLERLDDVTATLEGQLQGLKRQVRQASRYRNLSGHIRKAEAALLYAVWVRGVADLQAALDALGEQAQAVEQATRAAARAATALEASAGALPPLREAERGAAAAVHRLDMAGERLDEEERRVLDERRQLQARCSQIAADAARERARLDDAAASIARLDGERETLAQSPGEDEGDALAGAAEALRQRREEVASLETELAGRDAQIAETEAERRNLRQVLAGLTRELVRLNQRRIAARRQRDGIVGQPMQADMPPCADLAPLEREVGSARAAHEAASQALAARREGEAEARDALRRVEAEVSRLKAEEAALAALLDGGERGGGPSLSDAVTVEPGYEAALAAALADELDAPADPGAPVHWRRVAAGEAPPLPNGVAAMADFVAAPDLLGWRLSQIGVVEDAETGAGLQPSLKQGQRLVSRGGALWRWDGYTVAAGAPTMAGARFEQRNRLRHLRGEVDRLRPAFERSRRDALAARSSLDGAAADEARALETLRGAEDALHGAREAVAEYRREAAERRSLLQAVAATLAEIGAGEAALGERRREAMAALAALPAIAELRMDAERMREKLSLARARRDRAHAEFSRMEYAANARAARLAAVEAELKTWRGRETEARAQIAELEARERETRAALARITGRPAEIRERREKLLVEIAAAKVAQREAADRLVGAESAEAVRSQESKRAEGALAASREGKIRREAAVEQLEERDREVRRRSAETLGCPPQEARALAGLKDDAEAPDIDATEARLQRLQRERENMGPVNLRAEQEAAEVGQRLQTLLDERADLEAAIARLRQGIASLNREGRERLLAAFTRVDSRFRELFSLLFGGGRAHLSLTDGDDPLEAGVEIMASPPGKRLQVLSLLSGGEQALTAIALLVAVFQTNPAPICVLDEVDAPLDESNVERFCDLIDSIAKETDTRFLIVTHNAVTMARLDRLYGVTMAERGVSQLVSVDLLDAEGLRATA